MKNANAEMTDKLKPITWKEKFIKEGKSLSLILLLVLGFRSTFFEPFRIPTGSMIPTLMIGDFILVNKFSYGFKVPFVHWFSDPIYITTPSQPERGDVVVFKYPVNEDINFIKRVIGLPGDKIQIKDKTVYINGEPVVSTEITDTQEGREIDEDMDDSFKGKGLRYFMSQTGQKSHYTQIDEMKFSYGSDDEIFEVPAGHFFVMGDNRDYSSDSRFWGFVPFENIKGKALFVWFSMIFPFSDNDFKFRPWRIGTSIK